MCYCEPRGDGCDKLKVKIKYKYYIRAPILLINEKLYSCHVGVLVDRQTEITGYFGFQNVGYTIMRFYDVKGLF